MWVSISPLWCLRGWQSRCWVSTRGLTGVINRLWEHTKWLLFLLDCWTEDPIFQFLFFSLKRKPLLVKYPGFLPVISQGSRHHRGQLLPECASERMRNISTWKSHLACSIIAEVIDYFLLVMQGHCLPTSHKKRHVYKET